MLESSLVWSEPRVGGRQIFAVVEAEMVELHGEVVVVVVLVENGMRPAPQQYFLFGLEVLAD